MELTGAKAAVSWRLTHTITGKALHVCFTPAYGPYRLEISAASSFVCTQKVMSVHGLSFIGVAAMNLRSGSSLDPEEEHLENILPLRHIGQAVE